MSKQIKYKESGDMLLGLIPENWELKRIKYVSKVQGRVGFKGYSKNDIVSEGEGALTIGAKHIKKNKINIEDPEYLSWEKYYESPEIYIEKGQILVVQRGSLGKVAIVEDDLGPATINPSMVILKDLLIDTKYLYYIFCSKYFLNFIDLINSSTAVPMISQEQLGNLFIPKPSLGEIEKINLFLDQKTAEIDNLISKKQKLIDCLKEERMAIINQAVTKGINPNAEMKDSNVEWLGRIPKVWTVKKLKYVLNFLDYKRVPLSSDERGKMTDKTYDYYGASGVIDKVEDYIFDGTYILLGEDGANLITRSTELAFIATGKFWVNNHAHILEPKNGNIFYYKHILECYDYSPIISGSAQPKLTAENLANIEILEPPKADQNLIIDFLNSRSMEINNVIKKIEKEIELIKEYRTSLINEVVTGKKQVV